MKIDEKIEMLIQWRKEYPKAKVSRGVSENILKGYAKTYEEYRNILEEYKKMQGYYEYARQRKGRGKLPRELALKCKEGNIGGVFGYSSEVERLAKETGEGLETIAYIINEYGTIANFKELYLRKELNEEDLRLGKAIVKSVLDIDFGPNSANYDRLYSEIARSDRIELYSSVRLQEAIDTLPTRAKFIIESRFGLSTSKKTRTLVDLGKELGITGSRVAEIEKRTIRRLRHPSKHKTFRYYYDGAEDESMVPDEYKDKIHELIEAICSSDLLIRRGNTKMSISDEILQGIELLRNNQERINQRRYPEIEEFFTFKKPEGHTEEAFEKEMGEYDEGEAHAEAGDNEGKAHAETEYNEGEAHVEAGDNEGEVHVETEANKEEFHKVEEEKDAVAENTDKAKLEEARAKKAELQAQIRELKAKLEEARTLMQAYDELLGESEIESDEDRKK